jgi:tetratricopeptide (TPR) repeat protein
LKSDSIAIGLQIDRIFHDDVLTQNLGIEYNYHRLCALRLGYQKRPEGSDIRLGLGLNVKDFSLDYGMGLIQTFNNIQHFSVTYRFTVPGIQYGATAPLEKIARSIKAAVTNKRYLDAVTDIQRLRGVVTDSQEAIRFSHQIQTEMQEIVQSGPSSYRYNYALALNSYEQGRWDEVVEYLQTYQRSDPLNEEVKRFLATARTKIDDQNKQLLIQQQARTGVLFEIANQAYDAGDISRAQRIIDEILRVGPYQPAESLRRKIKSYQEVAPKALIVQPAAKVVSPSPVQVEKTANDPVQAEALYYEALRDYANNDLNAAVSKLTLSCKLDPTKESYRNPLERIKKELEQRKSPGLKK